MPTELDIIRRRHGLERTKERNLDFQTRQFDGRHRVKPRIGAARGDGALADDAGKRLPCPDVADATAESAVQMNRDEGPVRVFGRPGQLRRTADAGHVRDDGDACNLEQSLAIVMEVILDSSANTERTERRTRGRG